MATLLDQTALPAASDDYRRFPISRQQYHEMGERGYFDGVRVELLRGEIVVMSPMNWRHSLGVNLSSDVLRNVFAAIGWVNLQSPIATEDSEPEPDVSVYSGKARDYSEHPTPGDALLVVEVAVSSLRYDMSRKAKFYAEEGVADYWVLDVDGRRLFVFRDPIDGAYSSQSTYGEAEAITPLAKPEAIVRVADLLP